jgi:nuclear pore complex protein Nup93
MDFKQLLEQSRQLTTHIVTPHAPLERGLEHIEAQTRRLLSRTRSDHVKKDRASYLLANRGFDAEKVSETLNRINLALSFEPLDSIPDTDINGYLRNDHENIVSAAIEEQKKQTILDFEKRFENAVHSDWQNVKRRIMDHQPNDSIKSI